jgi:hypothetical protein
MPAVDAQRAWFPANVIDQSEFKRLDREWGKHRKANGLDACGNRPES